MSNGEDPTVFTVIGAKGLKADAEVGSYVTISMGNQPLFRTKSVTGESPQWNDSHPTTVSGPQSFSITIHRENPNGDTLLGEMKDIIVSSGPTELILPIEPLTSGPQIVVIVSIKCLKDMSISSDNNHSERLVCLSDFIIKSLSDRHPNLPCSSLLSVAIVVNGNTLYETTAVKKEPSDSHWNCNGKVILSSSMTYTIQVINETAPKKRLGFAQIDRDVLENPQENCVRQQLAQYTEDDPCLKTIFTTKVLGHGISDSLPQAGGNLASTNPVTPPAGLPLGDVLDSPGNSVALLGSKWPSSSHPSSTLDGSNHSHIPSGQSSSSPSSEPPGAVRMVELGVQFLGLFESEQSLPYLERAISLFHDTIELLPDGHQDRAFCLWKYGRALLRRFELQEKLPDINLAVAILENSISHFTDGHPSKTRCIRELGTAFQCRYERLQEISDLQNAISMKEMAVELTPTGHPERAECLSTLGSSLQNQFERQGEILVLDKAIAVLGNAVELTPAGHPNKAAYLNNLGNSYQTQYDRLGEISNLEKGISALENAVEITPAGHPNKAMYLSNLGASLQRQFQRQGEISVLEKAISVQEKAVEVTQAGQPNKVRYLSSLGLSLQMQFERLGQIPVLEKAISAFENAVELTPTDNPNTAMYLSNLGSSLQRQFEMQGEITVLERAISALESAVELTPTGHPDKAMYLSNLGISLGSQFERLGELSALEKAISTLETAVELTPAGYLGKAMYLSNLGNCLRSQFERLGEIPALEKAISVQEEAVQLTPTGHLNKPMYLSNLGISLQRQFERLGNISVLENAISAWENAVKLTPAGHPDKAMYLNNLGISLWSQFERLGEIPALEKAISVQEQAVQLTPTGHLNKPMYLSNLGISLQRQFERLGKISVLENAISACENAVELTPAGHSNKAMYLSNLGNSYQSQFERLGDISDLEKSISVQEKAVELTPTGHPSKGMYLSNLGISLQRQFERLGKSSDLEKAISAFENAVELTPTDNPNTAMYLSNLGSSLQRQFEMQGEITVLERAIAVGEKAVELTPIGHPDKAMYLHNLGNSLGCQFDRLGEISALEKAISVVEKAVGLTPTGHPDKAMYLSNLGTSFQSQFDMQGEISVLDKAISAFENAVELTPIGHPNKPTYLHNLGHSLLSQFQSQGEILALENAISALENALELTPTGHPNKPLYFTTLGASFYNQFEKQGEISVLTKAISALENAVELTPTGHPDKAMCLIWLGILLQGQFESLGDTLDITRAIDCFSQASQSSTSPPLVCFRGAVLWAECAEVAGVSSIRAYDHALHLLPHVAWIGLTILHRYALLAQVSNVVHYAAAAAISSGQYEIALEWLEQGRSIVWGQLLHLRTPVDELLVKEPELATQLLQVSQALEQGSSWETDLGSSLSSEQIAKNQHVLAAQWDKLIKEVHLVPGFEGFLSPKTVSQLSSAAKLGPIIAFSIHQAGCHALVLQSTSDGPIDSTPTGPSAQNYHQTSNAHTPPLNSTVVHIPLPNFSYEKAQDMQGALEGLCRSRFAREVEFEHERQTPQSTFEEILSDLWTLVVLPILDGLTLSVPKNGNLPHIWWCPSGPLAFLPIHAAGLYNTTQPGHKLSDFAVSSYTPTITALLNTQLNSPSMSFKILAIGQASNPGESPLPNTDTELEILKHHAGQLNVETLKGAQATVNDAVQGMSESTWVHLACHGTQKPADPMKSAFILADGHLELSRITTLSLPHAEFAFLSACQTATGDVAVQEEAVHLAAGMLMAGYRGVIATMWAILDEDAPQVADDVYAEILRNGQPDYTRAAYALHQATQNLRRRGAPFRSWVPFIHLGR